MQSKSPRRMRVGTLVLLLSATVFALGTCELALRVFLPGTPPLALGQLSYATADGAPVNWEQAIARKLIVPVPAEQTPRKEGRMMFAPSQSFFLCYSDAGELCRSWFDPQGRVSVRINRFGLREREQITPDKPARQKRIVCVGDSFTFGWGIPEEMNWVRLLEQKMRASGKDVRTVNCGASGTVCVDEYAWGLQHRFHVFQPDAVITTICLNDLIPSDGLWVIDPPRSTGLRTLDLLLGVLGRDELDLDPARDWVQELLDLPAQQALASHRAGHDKPIEAMWSQGVPQASLRSMKQWCDERKIPFMVILWPFLQGLGNGRHYPFQKLHDLVAADCKAAGIPFLDVLPALASTPAADLWVTPADPHPNPLAQRLTLPLIEQFVAAHCGF
ncbi:MAG TPA: GDSL-type esterase/lipase family protein [Planctomycetota bacterium]